MKLTKHHFMTAAAAMTGCVAGMVLIPSVIAIGIMGIAGLEGRTYEAVSYLQGLANLKAFGVPVHFVVEGVNGALLGAGLYLQKYGRRHCNLG